MNDPAPGQAPAEASGNPPVPVRETVPEDRRVSFLIHCDGLPRAADIVRARDALRERGYGRDLHFLIHGALAPVEALTVETGCRVFSSAVRLDHGGLRRLARTFGYFPWCCVLPLRNADRDTLTALAARGPEAWVAPEGGFAFNRLLEWREPAPVMASAIEPALESTNEIEESTMPIPVQQAPADPRSGPALSVVIPTFNRIDILERTLRGYADQGLRKDLYEVIVVDDGSTDTTWEVLERLKREMPYTLRTFRQENKGPGQARNLAMREAEGGIVFITGDDILPGPDLLWHHYRSHKENPERESTVLGKVDWAKDHPVNVVMHFVTERSSMQFGFCELDKGKKPDFRFFYTSNISIKKSFLEGKPWFRPEFVHAAYEDIELGYRLQKDGMRVVYEREAIGFHHHPMSIFSFARRQYKSGLMAPIFARMHPEMSEEIGFNAETGGTLDPGGIRESLVRLEALFPRIPAAAWLDKPWDQVPAAETAEITEALRFATGASYTLGMLDGVAEDLRKGLPPILSKEKTNPGTPAAAYFLKPGEAVPGRNPPPPAAPGRDTARAASLNAEGEALFGEGRLGQAVLRFCEALEADDRFAPAYNNLGVAAWKEGEAGMARRLFEQSLVCDPGFLHASDNREALASQPALGKA